MSITIKQNRELVLHLYLSLTGGCGSQLPVSVCVPASDPQCFPLQVLVRTAVPPVPHVLLHFPIFHLEHSHRVVQSYEQHTKYSIGDLSSLDPSNTFPIPTRFVKVIKCRRCFEKSWSRVWEELGQSLGGVGAELGVGVESVRLPSYC